MRSETNNADPYLQAKRDATRKALEPLPRLRDRARAAADPLGTAVRIAIAGNIIDHGVTETCEMEMTLERVLERPFGIDGLAALRRALVEVDSHRPQSVRWGALTQTRV